MRPPEHQRAVAAAICGIGSYLPERVLTNADLEQLVDTSDEWIVSRTGIRERHIVAEGEATSDMAAAASRVALERAGVSASDLDLIIVATSTPDMAFPATACLVQTKIGASCAAYDLNAACTGFIYALDAACAAIESGRARTVLVAGSDALSTIVDFADRSTCVLFGDGAGAVVVCAAGEPGILSTVLGADGAGADLLKVPGGGSASPATCESVAAREVSIRMNGPEVFKFAVRAVPKAARAALKAAHLTIEDLAWLVPHQANQRIMDAAAEKLHVPAERVFSNVAGVGNTSCASIPVALDDLYTSGRLAPGMAVVLVGFGAGLTWGATALRWIMPAPARKG